MAYNENINLFVTTDRNNADVFNAPLEKIIQNIQDTREYLYQLQTELDQLESKVQSEYTPTEQLNDLLAKGIKGDKGDTGESLEYNWDGTALGVKLESESDFTYRELKGEPGDVSTEQLEETLTNYPTLEYLEEVKTDLENEIANIHIPTSLPASDVYDWAKAPTKPTYTASEVGALASNGTAVNASKVSNALTLCVGGTVKNIFDGSTVQYFDVPNASTSTAGVMSSAMVTKLNGIATGANLIKTSKNTAKFSSQSAFGASLSSCIIGNNTVGGVWIFTGSIAYNISSAPSAGSSILSINQQMSQYEDVTIVCPCLTANNAYITLEVKSGTLYYKSYTGSAPTSGSRYFVSAVIPVSSTSFLS